MCENIMYIYLLDAIKIPVSLFEHKLSHDQNKLQWPKGVPTVHHI